MFVKLSPFLQFVSDTGSFDYQLSTYIQTNYVKDKYANDDSQFVFHSFFIF